MRCVLVLLLPYDNRHSIWQLQTWKEKNRSGIRGSGKDQTVGLYKGKIQSIETPEFTINVKNSYYLFPASSFVADKDSDYLDLHEQQSLPTPPNMVKRQTLF